MGLLARAHCHRCGGKFEVQHPDADAARLSARIWGENHRCNWLIRIWNKLVNPNAGR